MKMMLLAVIARQEDEILKFRLYDADTGQVGEYPYQNIYGVLLKGYSIEGLKISRKHIAANKNFNLNKYTWIDIATGQIVKNKNNLLVLRRHDDNSYTLVDINGNKARISEQVLRQNIMLKGVDFSNATISGGLNQIDINPLNEKFILETTEEAVKYNANAVNRQVMRARQSTNNKDSVNRTNRATKQKEQRKSEQQVVKPVIDSEKLRRFSEKYCVRKNDYGDLILQGVKPLDNDETDLIIPEGITVIDSGAFKNNQTIRNVYCPSTLKRILQQAFYNQNIEQLHVQEGLISIGTQAFCQTSNLTDFIGPESLEKIEYNGFCQSGIKYLKLKGKLESVQSQAFLDTKRLETAEIDCPKLVPGSNLFQDSSIRELKLDAIQTIGPFMFRGCDHLEEVRLPDKVKTIEESAFQWAYGLKRIYINNVTGYMCMQFGVQYNDNSDRSDRHIYLNGNIAKFKKTKIRKYLSSDTQFPSYTIHVKVPSKTYQTLLELQNASYSNFEIVREYDKNSKEYKEIERIKKLQSIQTGSVADIWMENYKNSNEDLNENNPISDKFDEYYPVDIDENEIKQKFNITERSVKAGSLRYELMNPQYLYIQGESGDPSSHTMIYKTWLTKKLLNFVLQSMKDDSWILDIPDRYFEDVNIHTRVLGVQLSNGIRLNQVTFDQRLFKNDSKKITVLIITKTIRHESIDNDVRQIDDEVKVLWTSILGETSLYMPDQNYQIPDVTLESNLKAGDSIGALGYSNGRDTVLCGQQAQGDSLNLVLRTLREDMYKYCVRFKMHNKDGYFWQPAQDRVIKIGKSIDKEVNIDLDSEYKQKYTALVVASSEYFEDSDLSKPEFWSRQFEGRGKDSSLEILKTLKDGGYYQDLSDYVEEAEPAVIADIANNYHNRIIQLDLSDLSKSDVIRLLEDSELFEKMTEDEATTFKKTACIKPFKEIDMGAPESTLKVYVQRKRAKFTKFQATLKGTCCEDPDLLQKGFHEDINQNLMYEYFDGESYHYGHTNYKPRQIEEILNTLNDWNTAQTKIKTTNLYALAKNGCVFSSAGHRYTNQATSPLFFGACTIKTKKRRSVRRGTEVAQMAFKVGINPVNGCQYLWIQLDDGALWALAPLKNIETGFKFIQALADGTEPEIVQRMRQMSFGDSLRCNLNDTGEFIQCVLRKDPSRYNYKIALNIATSLPDYIATNNSRVYEQMRDYDY